MVWIIKFTNISYIIVIQLLSVFMFFFSAILRSNSSINLINTLFCRIVKLIYCHLYWIFWKMSGTFFWWVELTSSLENNKNLELLNIIIIYFFFLGGGFFIYSFFFFFLVFIYILFAIKNFVNTVYLLIK